MGAGLAKDARQHWPHAASEYQKACKGRKITFQTPFLSAPSYDERTRRIVFFATKDTWQSPSKSQWIMAGLTGLVLRLDDLLYSDEYPKSIAVPALGCGLGGLRWEHIYPQITWTTTYHPDIDWFIYKPQGKSQTYSEYRDSMEDLR